MDNSKLVNIFLINGQQYAIAIENIIQIVRAVEITIAPQIPPFMYGVVDYHGQILPVINIRYCLGIEHKDIDIDDRLMILRTPNRVVVIVVDEVKEIISIENMKVIESKSLNNNMDFGTLIRLDNGIVFIYNIEKLISPENEKAITIILESLK